MTATNGRIWLKHFSVLKLATGCPAFCCTYFHYILIWYLVAYLKILVFILLEFEACCNRKLKANIKRTIGIICLENLKKAYQLLSLLEMHPELHFVSEEIILKVEESIAKGLSNVAFASISSIPEASAVLGHSRAKLLDQDCYKMIQMFDTLTIEEKQAFVDSLLNYYDCRFSALVNYCTQQPNLKAF
jgi:hypothetical protein